MTLEMAREFFGWVTLINLALFMFTAVMSILGRGFVQRVHGNLFELAPEDVNRALYNYLALYKIVFIVFCLAPWLALVIMTK